MLIAKGRNSMKVNFEVGKFYMVQPFGGFNVDNRKIKCECVRRSKCKVWFKYLVKGLDGVLKKSELSLRVRQLPFCEEAYEPGRWSGISPTKATEIADKPKIWDEIGG